VTDLPKVDWAFKQGRSKPDSKAPEAMSVLSLTTVMGRLPLHKHPVAEEFVTHESQTTYPDEAIRARVDRAVTVAQLAGPLIRKGIDRDRALQMARDHLDWNEPLDVD
jgi:hypothetical protein